MSVPTIIVQARTGSTRFPGKVLADLHGAPMIVRLLERLQRCSSCRVAVATSAEPEDDKLARLVTQADVPCERGPLDDVLARYVQASHETDADPVVRITGDCPLADPELIERMLAAYREARRRDLEIVYLSNVRERVFPDGLDVEIVARDALEQAASDATDGAEREHVTLHLVRQRERYRHASFSDDRDHSSERWTVDYPRDLDFVRAVYAALYPVFGAAFAYGDVLELLERNPDLRRLQSPAHSPALPLNGH
jgi:spore coat polysaccharide biosynthesis protein SpsF